MKLTTVVPFVALLGTSVQVEAKSKNDECREKSKADECQNRVVVSVTELIYGLKDDVPVEVMDAFAAASSDCLSCVDKSNVKSLSTSDGSALSDWGCRLHCWCCSSSHCQDDEGNNFCPEQCFDRWPQCSNDGRRILTGEGDDHDAVSATPAVFEIDVCMDDLEPLDKSSPVYSSYEKMLVDFEKELASCYENKNKFYYSWSNYTAEDGYNLSLMAKEGSGGAQMMFGVPAVDTEGAKVTTYSADAAHQSTSQMIFYSALGFVAVSAFAVVGTAVVVKILNNRRSVNEEQASLWVAEMQSTDVSSTP